MEKIAWKHDWVKKTEKNDWVNSWEEWLEKMSRKCDLEKDWEEWLEKTTETWMGRINEKYDWEK